MEDVLEAGIVVIGVGANEGPDRVPRINWGRFRLGEACCHLIRPPNLRFVSNNGVGAGCQKGLDFLLEQSVYVLAGVGRVTRPRTSAPTIAPIRGSRR